VAILGEILGCSLREQRIDRRMGDFLWGQQCEGVG